MMSTDSAPVRVISVKAADTKYSEGQHRTDSFDLLSKMKCQAQSMLFNFCRRRTFGRKTMRETLGPVVAALRMLPRGPLTFKPLNE